MSTMGHDTGYQWEICDPVKDLANAVEGVVLSDFVLPAWFDEASAGQFDALHSLRSAYSMSVFGNIGSIELLRP